MSLVTVTNNAKALARFNNQTALAVAKIPRSLNYANNHNMLNAYMTSFYNKNPDLRNNLPLLLARVSAAVIPALSTLLAFAAKRGESFVRGLFISKNDKALLRKFGITSANGGVINNLRRIGYNTRASNNRAIVNYNAANRAANNYRGNNLNEIRRRANNLNAQRFRVWQGIMRTVLLLLLSIKLGFGIILQETKKLANVSTYNNRTISNNINILARVLYVLMNAVIPAIYAIVQTPAAKMLGGGRASVELAAGAVSAVATKFAFDEAAVRLMMSVLGDISAQATAMMGSKYVKAAFNAASVVAPGSRNVMMNAGTSLLRLARGSVRDLIKWLAKALASGVVASALYTASNAGMLKGTASRNNQPIAYRTRSRARIAAANNRNNNRNAANALLALGNNSNNSNSNNNRNAARILAGLRG